MVWHGKEGWVGARGSARPGPEGGRIVNASRIPPTPYNEHKGRTIACESRIRGLKIFPELLKSDTEIMTKHYRNSAIIILEMSEISCKMVLKVVPGGPRQLQRHQKPT